MLKKYNNTKDLFQKIENLHKSSGQSSSIAGKCFEEFNMFALPSYVGPDIVGIWDTNYSDLIPPKVIKDIFGQNWSLMKEVLKGSSYGLDKIVEFNNGTYGFVSDKSVIKETLSKDKIEGLLTLYPKLHDKISEWIICTNAKRIPSRVAEITKGVITYVLYDDYVPDIKDQISQQKHELLWDYIKESLKHSVTPKILSTFSFAFRNALQQRYTDDSINFANKQFQDGLDTVKHWSEGTMGLGKSLLDAYIMCMVQKANWSPERTNSLVPVNISVFDKRSNAKQNGERLINIKKQYLGASKVIWVTQADDVKENEDTNIPYKQVMDVNKIVFEILSSIKQKIPVEVITLHCHIKHIERVIQDLQSHIDGFRIWGLNIDECDLLGALDKASTWNGWCKLRPCHQHGSTGTPIYSKGKVSADHPFMDNLNRWGPRTAFVSVKEAQDNKLIPPLLPVLVGVKLSELSNLPGMPKKPKNGMPILKTPVNGFNTVIHDGIERVMNVEELGRFFAVLKAMVQRPELFLNKHITGFSHFLGQAKLFRENFKTIINHIDSNGLVGKKLKGLLILLLNEKKDGTINKKKLDTFFDEKEAIIISQKLLGRGTDLQFQTAFHIVLKTTREMLQEVFRLMRLADLPYNHPKQQRYYIMPVIINDIDPSTPTIDQEFADRLNDLLENFVSAKTEMEEIWRKGTSSGGGGGGGGGSLMAIDIDGQSMNAIVKTMSQRHPTGGIASTMAEKLHTKIFNKMIQIPVPTCPFSKKKIIDGFISDPDYVELLRLSSTDDKKNFLRRFWRGEIKICKQSSIIRKQVQQWSLYVANYKMEREQSLGSVLPIIRKYYKDNNITGTKVPDKLKNIVLPVLEKLNINTKIKSGERAGTHLRSLVGNLAKGIEGKLSEQDRIKQQQWYQSLRTEIKINYQAMLDKFIEIYTFGVSPQPIARDFNVPKKEATAVCYDARLYPSQGIRTDAKRYEGIDRTKFEDKVTKELNKWTDIAEFVWDMYKSLSEQFLHQHPNSSSPANKKRNAQIIKAVKDKFGIEIDVSRIKSFVGPWDNKRGDLDRLEHFDNCYTGWCQFAHSYYKESIKWWKSIDVRVASIRINLATKYKTMKTTEIQKLYPQWDLKQEFLLGLRREHFGN